MAEINLLSTEEKSYSSGPGLIRILNYVGLGLVILAILITAIFYFSGKGADSKIASLNNQKSQLELQVLNDPHYPTLLADQQKFKNLQVLLNNHVNWSQFFPTIFTQTLKSATFTKFTVAKDGSALISGQVADFQNLDKLIEGFQASDFSSNINDIKLVNVSLAGSQVLFTLQVSLNNKNLLPNDPSKLSTATDQTGSTNSADLETINPGLTPGQ